MLTRARVLVVSISLRTGLDMNPQDHWLIGSRANSVLQESSALV